MPRISKLVRHCIEDHSPRMARSTGTAVVALALALLFVAPSASAQGAEPAYWWTLYLQQSFPKQTNTNAQIDMINDMFGSDFDTWDDIVNLSVGTQLFRQVSPRWKLGVELDVSMGQLDGESMFDTGVAGRADLKFVQKYSIYTNVLAVAHLLPCPQCKRVIPFGLGGAGIG